MKSRGLQVPGDREVLDLTDDVTGVIHDEQHPLVLIPKTLLGELGSQRWLAHHTQREVITSRIEVRHEHKKAVEIVFANQPQLDLIAAKHSYPQAGSPRRLRNDIIVLA